MVGMTESMTARLKAGKTGLSMVVAKADYSDAQLAVSTVADSALQMVVHSAASKEAVKAGSKASHSAASKDLRLGPPKAAY